METKKEYRLYGKGNPELRKLAKIAAAHLDLNLEDWITDAIKEKISRQGIVLQGEKAVRVAK